MPSGYTATLYEGEQSFPDFALACARAFGALITLRDQSIDAPVPETVEPSTYYAERAVEHRARIAEVEGWSEFEADDAAHRSWHSAWTRWNAGRAEQEARKARYESMIAQVEAWEPPTPDHVQMKRFMLDQLSESLRFDCDYDAPEPVEMTGVEYALSEVEQARRDLARCEAIQAEENERAASRTAWLVALRDSLKAVA